MPRKDPQEYKEYMRNKMRERRQAAKDKDTLTPKGAELPPPSVSTIVKDKPLSTQAPARQRNNPAPQELGRANINPDQPLPLHETDKPENWHLTRYNRWLDFPTGEGFIFPWDNEKVPERQGYACCKGPGRCCLPLRHELPRGDIQDCVFKPPDCIYYKRHR